MSLCACCGVPIGDVGLCAHHHAVDGGDDWAVANRIMCDFVHRRRVPRGLTQAERVDHVNTITVTLAAGDDILQIESRWSDPRRR
jgi:hypothetical protein